MWGGGDTYLFFLRQPDNINTQEAEEFMKEKGKGGGREIEGV